MPYIQFEKIQIGPITIYIWGLFLALGILFVFFYSLKLAKNKLVEAGLQPTMVEARLQPRLQPTIITDAFFWLLIGLIVGARLGHVLEYLNYYLSNPIEIFKIWQGGMAFFGGLIGILISGIIFAKIKKITAKMFFKIADIIALAAPLGIAVGRIGCCLINDHQSVQTSLPWAINWPDGTMRHPVAEYLILANIIIFFILKFLSKKLNKPGQLFFAFLFLYSVSRFFLDFTRSADPLYFSLSTAQWLSLVVILGIIIKKLIKRSQLKLNWTKKNEKI